MIRYIKKKNKYDHIILSDFCGEYNHIMSLIIIVINEIIILNSKINV